MESIEARKDSEPTVVMPGQKSRLVSVCDAIIETGWLTVVFGVPLAFNPLGWHWFSLYKASLLGSVVCVMAACCLVKPILGSIQSGASLRQGLKEFFSTPLVIPAIALALAYIISTVSSVSPFTSFWGSLGRMMGTYTVLSFVVFFLIVALHLRSRRQIERLVWATIGASSLVCIVGIVQWLGWAPVLEAGYGDWRVGSTIGYPIFLGSYLLLTTPLTVAKLISGWLSRNRSLSSVVVRVVLSLALTLQMVTLVLTNARGPWLGFAVMASVFVIAIALKQHRKRLLISFGLLGSLCIILFMGLILPQSPLHQLSSLPYISRATEMTDMNSSPVRGRLLIWKSTAELVTDYPSVGFSPDKLNALRPLVGYGPETLAYTFDAVYPSELRYIESQKTVDRAHNILLELMATVGLIGLACFLIFVCSFFYHGTRWLRKSSDYGNQLLLVALMAALAGYLMEQMFGIANSSDQVQLWANAALLVAVIRLSKESEASRPAKEFSPVSSGNGMSATRLSRKIPRVVLALVGTVCIVCLGCSTNVNFLLADVEAHRGHDYIKNEDWIGAVFALDKAVELAPDRAFHQWDLARLCLNRAQEVTDPIAKEFLFNEAANRFEAAISLEPLNGDYHHELAQTYVLWESIMPVNKYEEAVESYQQTSKLKPFDVEALDEWALLDSSHGEYDSALERLELSLEIDPNWGRTYYALGLVYQEMGESDAAIAAYQTASELSPELQPTCQLLTDALLAQS